MNLATSLPKLLFPDRLNPVVLKELGSFEGDVVELQQYASKLPSWLITRTSQGQEDQFRLRFFVVTADGNVTYYFRQETYTAGKPPMGSINANECFLNRESKLEFSLTALDGSRRMWIRCMSEPLLLQFMTACSKVGATTGE